jgi:uncharacterized membrane protein
MIDPGDFWRLTRALHVLGAVVWVGGMFFAILIMRPALADLDAPRRVDIYRGAFGRFFRVIWIVMPGMLLTGYFMLFGEYGGFAGAGWNVHLMHMLGLAMAAIFVGIWFGPYQQFRNGQGRAIEVIRPMIIANMLLGLVTVAIAALG